MATSPSHSKADSCERQSPSHSTTSPSEHSQRKWYHRTLGQAVPSSPGGLSPNRLGNFAGFKELVKSASWQRLRASASDRTSGLEHDDFRQQSAVTVNSLPGDPKAPRCRPPTLIIQPSDVSSSIESLTPDQSGMSHDASQPETPSSTDFRRLPSLTDGDFLANVSMENNTSSDSTVIRKPVPAYVKEKEALVDLDDQAPDSNLAAIVPPDEKDSAPTLRHRTSTVQVPIPRRRSSLTTLHLDRSHFEKPLSPKPSQFDARASSFSETFQPATESLKSATPTPTLQAQGLTSSAVQSTPLSNSRPSTAASQPQSHISSGLNYLHLPATFPGGKIATPTPPLTKTHYQCYQFHKKVRYSQNKTCPVPCMTCGVAEGDSRWKCSWCALRICGGCMAEFDSRGRNLGKLMEWLSQRDNEKASSEASKDKKTTDRSMTIRDLTRSESRIQADSASESPKELGA